MARRIRLPLREAGVKRIRPTLGREPAGSLTSLALLCPDGPQSS